MKKKFLSLLFWPALDYVNIEREIEKVISVVVSHQLLNRKIVKKIKN